MSELLEFTAKENTLRIITHCLDELTILLKNGQNNVEIQSKIVEYKKLYEKVLNV